MGPFWVTGMVIRMGLSVGFAASMEEDFGRIAQWLSQQTADGLAFHASASFDQPAELGPGEVGLDLTGGLGFLPLDLDALPAMQAPLLQQANVPLLFAETVPFPDATAHLRVGLPGRMDLSTKFSDTTIPQRNFTERTKGKGQSVVIGGELRKYFIGEGRPLWMVAATADFVQGNFIFFNRFENLSVNKNILLSSSNKGELEWNIQSYGFKTAVSGHIGDWTPFLGLGYNYNRGSVHADVEANFDSELIGRIAGQASARPDRHLLRVTTGTQWDWGRFSLALNGEMLAIGEGAWENFAMTLGLSIPIRLLPGSPRHDRWVERTRSRKLKEAVAFSGPIESRTEEAVLFLH